MAQTKSIETLYEPDYTEQDIVNDLFSTLDILENIMIDPEEPDFSKKVKITITVEEIS